METSSNSDRAAASKARIEAAKQHKQFVADHGFWGKLEIKGMTDKQFWAAGLLGAAIIVGAFLFVFSAFVPNPPAPASRVEQARAAASDLYGGFVAVDEAAFHDMMSAAVAGDNAALMRLGVDGRVFQVAEGTQTRLIDWGLGKKRVSILSGPQAGRSGWVPT